MRAFVPSEHARHAPTKDYSDGLPPFDHLEVPARVELLLAGAREAMLVEPVEVAHRALDEVLALHDRDYVQFLLALPDALGADAEYLPAVFRGDLSRAPLLFQGGMYCKEVGTPVGAGSIDAALSSAAAAVAAAQHALGGDDALAACRPPGHHAGRRRYGGYCFFNNAYLAARELSRAGRRCAVIDLDYHLGDGSLEFATPQAPYFSLHADPFRNYPYLDASHAAVGAHATLLTFEPGTTGAQYLARVDELLAHAVDAGPDVAVISLGFDTLGSDYVQDETTAIVATDYEAIGARVARCECPLLFVFEGGYDADNLQQCSRAFFGGFASARG